MKKNRTKANTRRDRKKFRRTATHMNAKNIPPEIMRGGYRL